MILTTPQILAANPRNLVSLGKPIFDQEVITMEELINFDLNTAIWCCIDKKIRQEDLEKLEAVGKILAQECLAMTSDIRNKPELKYGSMFARCVEAYNNQGHYFYAVFDAMKACGTGASEEARLNDRYQAHLVKSRELCTKFRRQLRQLDYELEKLDEYKKKLDWPWRMYHNWIIYKYILGKKTHLERVLGVTEKTWLNPVEQIPNNAWGKAYRAAEDHLRQFFLNTLRNISAPEPVS